MKKIYAGCGGCGVLLLAFLIFAMTRPSYNEHTVEGKLAIVHAARAGIVQYDKTLEPKFGKIVSQIVAGSKQPISREHVADVLTKAHDLILPYIPDRTLLKVAQDAVEVQKAAMVPGTTQTADKIEDLMAIYLTLETKGKE